MSSSIQHSPETAKWIGRFELLRQFWFASIIPAPVVREAFGSAEDRNDSLIAVGIIPFKIGNAWFVRREQIEFLGTTLAAAVATVAPPAPVAAPVDQPRKPDPAAAYWTASEVARFLGVSVRSVYRLADDGKLKRYPIGGKPKFRVSDVRHYASCGG